MRTRTCGKKPMPKPLLRTFLKTLRQRLEDLDIPGEMTVDELIEHLVRLVVLEETQPDVEDQMELEV